MKRSLVITIACLGIGVSCDSETTSPADHCNAFALPLSGAANAPVVVAVSLEVQASVIAVLATATDLQGTDNLLGVDQVISVFPDVRCAGAPIVLQDDLAGSGIEESFGTAVSVSADANLYHAIAAATSWPVAVDFRDQDGNRTTGRVMAAVVD